MVMTEATGGAPSPPQAGDAITDIHCTLAYGSEKLAGKWLGLGLLLLVLGGVLLYIRHSFSAYDWFMLGLTFVLGIGITLYALLQRIVPGKPLLVISPEGLRQHIPWVKDVVIPWREVQGVDTVDISGSFNGTPVLFRGVTVVLVTRRFYDRHIHVRSWLMRGPGWDTNYIPRGSQVEVALHHEALRASAQQLRTAVETRWRAFGRP